MRPEFARTARLHAGPFLVLGLLIGCGSAAVARLDPKAATDAALAEFDSNKDGTLDAKELAKCPGLRALAAKMGKTSLSSEDLLNRFTACANYPEQLMAYTCIVLMDGSALPDAEVTLIPEKMMGDGRKPAKGKADTPGNVRTFQIDGFNRPGVPPGVYRIEVTKKGPSGQETVPANYNTQSTIGCEVGPPAGGARGTGTPDDGTLKLTSR